MSTDDFKNSPWCAYAEGKQAWKKDGNYYSAEELAEMDKLDDFQIVSGQEPIVVD